MENKDIEKQIKESVDKIEVRDFSLVWDNIKHRIDPKKEYAKKKRVVRWVSAAASFVALVIGCAVVLPITINYGDKEPVYFMEQLGAIAVEEFEFYDTLTKEKINHVDFSDYIQSNYTLLQTENNVTKGGAIDLSDDVEEPTFLISIQFYDDKVKGFELDSPKFDLCHQVEGITVYYRILEAYPEESWYVYEVHANYNSVNYSMEYTCFSENITSFLDNFFK